jgi:hypothetical protein
VDRHVAGGVSDQLLGLAGAAFVYLNAVNLAAAAAGRPGQDLQPLTGGQQEGGLTA